MARIRHVVLDMDGTIYKGSRLFAWTLPLLACLGKLGVGYTFLTNNTSRSKSDYVEKLRLLGIQAGERQILTPADSAIVYLRDRLPLVESIAVLGTPSLCRQFEEAGFEVGWDAPQAVIAGFDTTLTYERLCRAAYWISPTDELTVLVDCGAICAALTAATGRPPVVLGKPDPSILLDLCHRLGLAPAQVAMVGDRISTDVAMAQKAGVFAVLVLSGEATAEDAAALSPPPDLIAGHAGELGELLERARAIQALS
jgi:HAD superfamily hydrolase (TIGR01450 family)